MKRSKTQSPDKKAWFSDRRLAVVSILIVAIVVSGVTVARILVPIPEPVFAYNAAIVDQIGENYPSSREVARFFNQSVTWILQNAGFNVSYHKSLDINVSFYQELAKSNYGLIIIRAHSAVRIGEAAVDFFTSQGFDASPDSAYAAMVADGQLAAGSYSWLPNEYYFAITPRFMQKLNGIFPRSIVIATGCTSLNSSRTQMAQAFIGKGAKAYFGWTDFVSLSHSDNSTIRLLQYIFVGNKTMRDAVSRCNELSDPWYRNAQLAYYPSEIGNLKLRDLTGEAALHSFQLAACAALSRRGGYVQRHEELYLG